MKRDKKQCITACLTVLFGWCGAHHFYNKRYLKGTVYFFTVGLFCIGWWIDILKLLFHKNESPSPNQTNTKQPTTNSIERHHVAGPYYYKENIEKMAVENPDYSYGKKDFIDIFGRDRRVYKYLFNPHDIQLIEEPENPYDANAIKVVVDNYEIGHIKKGSCTHVKKLLHSNKIANITCEIGGGEYKICTEDYEGNEIVQKKRSGYYAVLTLFIV